MRSILRTLDSALLRNIALVCVADGLVGISYGAIAVSGGLDPWVPVALSVLVLAGSAEFLFVGIVGAGGSPIAAVFAGLLVNARHLPFGLAVGDVLDRGWTRVLGSHLMNDESVVFALSQADRDRRRAAFWVCGVGIAICWPLGAFIGALIGNAVGDTAALGLDAMFPAVLLALVLPALRDRDVRGPALAGAVIALVTTPLLPAGLPILASLLGLLIGFWWKVLR
ncbi:branched-chain amino acid permease [Rhodococcus sp. WMMA185]|uniref:AzlC family ABC transporter permease n=1 Tax=Rhodococcus sp. WMMA185 TaxID=679318 RepID=UPI0008783758|nr:AzlC family ABC transporter permease [Rhodococcus sp. WMMA185]AOW92632.1 branched-chain amino acid permease [Rhodococcus sp. WMMA185]